MIYYYKWKNNNYFNYGYSRFVIDSKYLKSLMYMYIKKLINIKI